MKSLVLRHFAAFLHWEWSTSTTHGHEEPLQEREAIKSGKQCVLTFNLKKKS